MSAANPKNTYTAAEVAEMLHTLQEENEALKRKLEHMNE